MAAKKPVKKPYVTSGEAAEMLMVSPKTVQRWHKAGHIEGSQTLGGRSRYSRTHIESIASRIANFEGGQ